MIDLPLLRIVGNAGLLHAEVLESLQGSAGLLPHPGDLSKWTRRVGAVVHLIPGDTRISSGSMQKCAECREGVVGAVLHPYDKYRCDHRAGEKFVRQQNVSVYVHSALLRKQSHLVSDVEACAVPLRK